jgi:hypothetical protein
MQPNLSAPPVDVVHVEGMSDFATQAALVQAVFDLKVVQSIRSAVRINTLTRGGVEGPLGNIENPKPGVRGQFGIEPEPRYEPRRVVEPEPRFETRHVEYRTVERPAQAALDDPILPEQTTPPVQSKSPLAPPWEMPMPLVEKPVLKVVKYEAAQPDLISKGMLIDLFI